jgi:hypothetical protein
MKNAIFWDITPCNPLEVNRAVHGVTSQKITLFSACSHQPKTPDFPNEITSTWNSSTDLSRTYEHRFLVIISHR